MPRLFFVRRQGWKKRFPLWNQCGYMNRSHQPHAFLLDVIVFMNKYVTLRDYPLPGNFRMRLFKFVRDATAGFPNDFNTAFDGEL